MLIQKEIEEKIKLALAEKFATKGLKDSVTLRGSWDVAGFGLSRWVEGVENSKAFVSVAVATPEKPSPNSPVILFAANITIFIRCERDTTGEMLCALAEAVQELIDEWMNESCQADFLSLDGTHSIDAISLQGGSSPVVENSIATVNYPLTLQGIFKQ